MRERKIRGVICRGVVKGVPFCRCITASAFLLLLHCVAISCFAAELKQKTVTAIPVP